MLTIDEIRCVKMNTGYPHAVVRAEGWRDGVCVCAASAGQYPKPDLALAGSVNLLLTLARLAVR
jgi:hypothetical protein